ncbi:MAG: M20/M25/M40 family metallo-hydrolase [Acidobacteriota bacterium]
MLLRALVTVIALVLLSGNGALAQPLPDRFLTLVQAQGVAGREGAVCDAVQAQLPRWARPRVDELGNLVLTLGSGRPHVAIVASLDEGGYVVSCISDDGYLRLHRHTAGAPHRLGDQFMLGQPVVIRTSHATLVPGVTATESTHLRSFLGTETNARVRSVQDLWVDVGARNAAEVQRLGIRLLDTVSLRERAQALAAGRVAGVSTRARAGAQALVEVLRAYSSPPAPQGTITLAWVAQSQFGGRGLARLARTMQPDHAILLSPEPSRRWSPPAGWEKTSVVHKSVPALFTDTPVEVVDSRDIAALALELTRTAGLASSPAGAPMEPAPAPATAAVAQPVLSPTFTVLKSLIETSGVSGQEGPVRDAILRQIPAWANPQVDAKGNITVTFGAGGQELLFIAHMDEIGFEITGIRDDGRAMVRTRGGMVLSLYEAHPVLVQTPGGPVPAVVAPRDDYQSATTQLPDIKTLALYFGTVSAAETEALGVRAGQTATVRKRFEPLAGTRATGRSMDDRGGSTALLLALRTINPSAVRNRVSFAWTVEEETGLAGARALAERLHPAVAFAVDTFVTSDAPLDVQHLAHAPLGGGAVLRILDSRSMAAPMTIDRVLMLAQVAGVPLQLGMTLGGTDAAAFSAGGAADIGLSWPGRYSHSPVEVIDEQDLNALAKLIGLLAARY